VLLLLLLLRQEQQWAESHTTTEQQPVLPGALRSEDLALEDLKKHEKSEQ
jgi:hypothetical protein